MLHNLCWNSSKQNQNQDEEQIEEVMISQTGTLSEQLLPEDPMLKSQFRLNTIEDRQIQLLFIEDRIQKLKKHFNDQFNQSYRQKEAEISRIHEHNTRIEQDKGWNTAKIEVSRTRFSGQNLIVASESLNFSPS